MERPLHLQRLAEDAVAKAIEGRDPAGDPAVVATQARAVLVGLPYRDYHFIETASDASAVAEGASTDSGRSNDPDHPGETVARLANEAARWLSAAPGSARAVAAARALAAGASAYYEGSRVRQGVYPAFHDVGVLAVDAYLNALRVAGYDPNTTAAVEERDGELVIVVRRTDGRSPSRELLAVRVGDAFDERRLVTTGPLLGAEVEVVVAHWAEQRDNFASAAMGLGEAGYDELMRTVPAESVWQMLDRQSADEVRTWLHRLEEGLGGRAALPGYSGDQLFDLQGHVRQAAGAIDALVDYRMESGDLQNAAFLLATGGQGAPDPSVWRIRRLAMEVVCRSQDSVHVSNPLEAPAGSFARQTLDRIPLGTRGQRQIGLEDVGGVWSAVVYSRAPGEREPARMYSVPVAAALDRRRLDTFLMGSARTSTTLAFTDASFSDPWLTHSRSARGVAWEWQPEEGGPRLVGVHRVGHEASDHLALVARLVAERHSEPEDGFAFSDSCVVPLHGQAMADALLVAAYAHVPVGEAHERGHFYVSVIDGARRGLLAGPYETHRGALEHTGEVRRLATEVDPAASYYAFGTARVRGEDPPIGRLNDRLEAPPTGVSDEVAALPAPVSAIRIR